MKSQGFLFPQQLHRACNVHEAHYSQTKGAQKAQAASLLKKREHQKQVVLKRLRQNPKIAGLDPSTLKINFQQDQDTLVPIISILGGGVPGDLKAKRLKTSDSQTQHIEVKVHEEVEEVKVKQTKRKIIGEEEEVVPNGQKNGDQEAGAESSQEEDEDQENHEDFFMDENESYGAGRDDFDDDDQDAGGSFE